VTSQQDFGCTISGPQLLELHVTLFTANPKPRTLECFQKFCYNLLGGGTPSTLQALISGPHPPPLHVT
jgi:hypothetical protein